MNEILVLVDHVDGSVRKTTTELLTLARTLGAPSAVFIGTGIGSARDTLTSYGAEKIYVLSGADLTEYLVAPKTEALAQLVERTSPAAVLVPSTPEAREVAARLAVKTGSGLITDAVDVQPGAPGGSPLTTQSVFAGGYSVKATVTVGTPIVVVKPNAVTPEQAAGAGVEQSVEVAVSDAARTARIVKREPRTRSARPELT
ncbi:MAG: electron transfer flavoprotein subunit alpha/FixB family protein, partial [Actinomycetota bacterium]|nr:electron transfer flavoprotein subunit alpha/FixB family protein [Actinomycetota bacterium]